MNVWNFWKEKKQIDSKEYIELRKKLDVIELDVEQLQNRFKRKMKPKTEEEETRPSGIDDGMDELRKLNKEYPPA